MSWNDLGSGATFPTMARLGSRMISSAREPVELGRRASPEVAAAAPNERRRSERHMRRRALCPAPSNGEGLPRDTFGSEAGKLVDGRPTPTMTIQRERSPHGDARLCGGRHSRHASGFSSACALAVDEAGFYPVTSLPSVMTKLAQSGPFS